MLERERARVWSSAALLAGALGCVHPSEVPMTIDAGKAETQQLPSRFDLVSWNTHKQRHRGFSTELERFAAGAELLLLQEAVDVPPAWTELPAARAWILVVAFELRRHTVKTGVATGSTADPRRWQAMLTAKTEPFANTPKSSLLTWFDVDGASASLLVVNLHGINFRSAPALDAQLRALDGPISAHSGPVLVAGDFNTWSGNRREVVEEFVARHGLSTVFADGEAPRLDHVYVRGLVVHATQVLDSRSSDHDAVRVELELAPSGER